MIELRNIGIHFKNREILKNINLSVKSQSALSIIGPSGAGKSVLLKIIAGLFTPTEGSIHIASEKVSMLFQKNALFDSFTNLENLLLPLSETLKVDGDLALEKAMKMLKAVGLDHAAHLYPDEISGGMQKRLGIARALIIEPEVILYDEPTAGLDPITSRSIADLMIELHHLNKTTLVMVTKDLQRAYQVSDQIVFCSNQTLIPLGTPEEVKKSTVPEINDFIYSKVFSRKDSSSHS